MSSQQEHHKDLVLALTDYLMLEAPVKHRGLIEAELLEILPQVRPQREVTCRLLDYGCPRALSFYLGNAGEGALAKTSASCPLDHLRAAPGGSADTLAAIRLIKSEIVSTPYSRTVLTLRLACSLDDPDFLAAAADEVGISPGNFPLVLTTVAPWGARCPRMSAWTARYIETEFDPDDSNWRSFIEDCVANPTPVGLASLLRIGHDIKADFARSENDSTADWWQRFLERLGSAHGRLALHNDLPPVAEILSLHPNEACLLLAGKSAA